MQRLSAQSGKKGCVVFFVPRWLEDSMSPSGLPYRVVPVLTSLVQNGFEVHFYTEVHDGWQSAALEQSLRNCRAAVAWCAELNPGVQVPSLLGFLERVRDLAPDVPRIAGGGFFPMAPPPALDLAPLTDAIVTGQEVNSLSDHLLGRAPGSHREPFDVSVLRDLDLGPFLRPESMLFGNNKPSLQVPTASGCGKRCAFCFYEQTHWRVLSADRLVALLDHVQQRYGIDQFLFGELDFLASRRRAIDVVQGILARDLQLSWFALASVPDLLALGDDELLAMAQSGCVTLELGLEAGSDRALRALGKQHTVADAITAHRRLTSFGITPVYNLVFGWPGETRADQLATRALIRRLGGRGSTAHFNFRIYQAIPGTTMGEQALRFLPPLPTNLEELRRYRVDDERRLPWLTVRDERRVRFLTEYVLPLGYDDALELARPGLRRQLLRKLARLRTATGFLALPLDRRMFERTAAAGLPDTYLP